MPAKQWSHGDIALHTDFEAYSVNLALLYTDTDAFNRQPCVLLLTNTSPEPGGPFTFAFRGAYWRIVHVNRFLHYKGTGAIVDPAGIEEDVTLIAGSSGYGSINLDAVGWLLYGQPYYVEACEGCIELREG